MKWQDKANKYFYPFYLHRMHLSNKHALQLLHILYLVALLSLLAAHVLYPALLKGQIRKMRIKKVLDKYNTITDHRVQRMLVFNEYYTVNELHRCTSNACSSAEISRLYSLLCTGSLTRKTFLFYSLECNMGVFMSLSVPLLIITSVNLKKLLATPQTVFHNE